MPNLQGSGGTPFPCEVGAAISSKCWTCHGETLNFTAPMHLTSTESVHQMTKDGTEEIFKRMGERIHDAANPMPPFGNPGLTPQESAALDAWIAQGAPAGTGCAPPPPPPGGGGTVGGGGTTGGGTTGSGGVYYGGSPGVGGTSGAGGSDVTGTGGYSGPPAVPDAGGPVWSPDDVPVEPDPSECDMLSFHARQDASGAKYNVPSGEQYYCFGFHIPLEQGAQGLAFYKDIDNSNVIHHWLLYKAASPQTDGTVNACLGFHPDGELLAGWAPGANDWYLPSHVGLELGGGDFVLEVHYNNNGPPAQDASGVRVCKAKQQRPDTASVSWLGTEWISIPPGIPDFQVKSHCNPNITQPIHILKSWPHMHKLGTHMTATIHRSAGGTEPLVDVPFNFQNQWQYDTPNILNTGDWIENTCFYNNDTGSTVTFGEQTSQEMCYNFVVAYPAHALQTFGLMSTACNNP